MIMEWDSKIVVDAINSKNTYVFVFGNYVLHYPEIIPNSLGFTISFVKRDVNRMTHEFTRASRSYENSFYWFDPLNFVIEPLLYCNNEC